MAYLRVWLRKLFGGREQSSPGTLLSHARTGPSGPKPFVEENNDFALAMYMLLGQWPGNLFFSPFSIRTALSMTQAGAKGETAAQMREALRISSSEETLRAAFAETVQQPNLAPGGEYEMAVANSLWGQVGKPLQPGFVDLMAQHYGGGMNLVDFRRGAEAARVAMNRWVADKTRQKIQDLVPSGGLNAETRLVLVNAVYFKGIWVVQFQRAFTREERFYLGNGEKVQVPLMHQDSVIPYLQGAGYQAVDLVYRSFELSLLVLLPDRKDGIGDLEKKLSVRMLRDCALQMAPRGHCQLRRKRDVLFRNGRLSWSRLRPLLLSARPRRIAIAGVGDSSIPANGVLLGKDSGPHRGGRETVGLGQQI